MNIEGIKEGIAGPYAEMVVRETRAILKTILLKSTQIIDLSCEVSDKLERVDKGQGLQVYERTGIKTFSLNITYRPKVK